MNTKKNVLLTGLFGVTVLFMLFVAQESFCYETTWCRNSWDIINTTGMLLFFTPPLLFFSLLTYFMKDEVFRAWWNFARWWVPVIIGVTLFVQNAGGGGGWGMNGGAFDAFFIGIFYFTFIAGSFSKIIHMYFRLRMGKMVGSEIKIKKFNEIFGWVDRIILVPITLLILLVLYSLSL